MDTYCDNKTIRIMQMTLCSNSDDNLKSVLEQIKANHEESDTRKTLFIP